MVQKEVFQQFTIYKKDISKSFVYANFDNPDIFMDKLEKALSDKYEKIRQTKEQIKDNGN